MSDLLFSCPFGGKRFFLRPIGNQSCSDFFLYLLSVAHSDAKIHVCVTVYSFSFDPLETCFKDAVFYIMVDPCNPLHNFIVFLLPSIVGFQFCLVKHQCPVFIIYRSHCKLPELALIGHWNQWL